MLIYWTKSWYSFGKSRKITINEKSINRKVYLKDHDENLDEVIDRRDTQVYEHIDKPLVHELYPKEIIRK